MTSGVTPAPLLQPLFGVLVRRRRESLGLSQSDVGCRLGASGAYVSGVERGVRTAGLGTLLRFSAVLGLEAPLILSECLGVGFSPWWEVVLGSLPAPPHLGPCCSEVYSDALDDAGFALSEHSSSRADASGRAAPSEEF